MLNSTHTLTDAITGTYASYPFITITEYHKPKNLALIIENRNPSESVVISVNIRSLPDNHITIDSNNAEANKLSKILVNQGYLTLTSDEITSGFCNYPIAVVNVDKIQQLSEPTDM